MNGLSVRSAIDLATNRREYPDSPSVRNALSPVGRLGFFPERRTRVGRAEYIRGA
jgi:hypothetical protein